MINHFRSFVGAGHRPARLLFPMLMLLLLTTEIIADTHTATSCSQEHVQAAINAASDGDTVLVPAGTCTYTSPAQYMPAVSISNKAITVQGAGIGKTIITDSCSETWARSPFVINGVQGKPFRINGITFIQNPDANDYGPIFILGTCDNWRIDHCEFREGTKGLSISVIGDTYGVIDHCTFLSGIPGSGNNYKCFGINGNVDACWQIPLSLGKSNAVYVEDNLITYKFKYGASDVGKGGRAVFRYNTINNGNLASHGCDSNSCSLVDYESYENVFTHNLDDSMNSVMSFRGGTGVIFNNIVSGYKYSYFVALYSYCACGYDCAACVPCTSYPCKQQVGRAPDANGNEALEPLYEWNNTYLGGNGDIALGDSTCDTSKYIQQNRDYYNDKPRPGYVPYPYPHPLILADYPGQQRSLDLIATPAGGQINLTWKAVTGAISYSILRNWQQVVLVTGTSWSETPPSGQHVYMVYALDGSGKILAAEGKVISAIPQSVSLAAGWNWVSFNVLPDDLSLNSVFSGILDKIEQVKTQTQSALRSSGAWKGDLVNMNGIGQYKMFKVKVSAACTLLIAGTAFLSTTPIALTGGWNWVAFLPTTSMSITTALASINGQVLEVKSLTQSATYSGGAWSGTLTQLEPGQGYAIKMSTPGSLIYPTGSDMK